MQKCLIIDSYGFIFRAFHVQKGLTSPSGEPVGAIYGFTSMLIKLLSEMKPTHVVAVFDSGGKNFRHSLYPEYKSHRPPVDEDLKKQFPIAREVAKVMNIAIAELPGFEADDIIATLAERISKTTEVIVISSDKDLAQLMGDRIKIYDPVKSKILTQDDILEKFSVTSDKIRDVLALIGDHSDNIPGVPGFGPKTASSLINQFGSFAQLCTLYEQIDLPKKKEIFKKNLEQARLSYELIGLKCDVEINLPLQNLMWERPKKPQLTAFLNKYGFRSLLGRISKISTDIDPGILQQSHLQDNTGQTSFDIVSYSKIEKKPDISTDLQYLCELARSEGYISILEGDDIIYLAVSNILFTLRDIGEIAEILESGSIRKIFFSGKKFLKQYPKIRSHEDISIIAYILSAGNTQYDIFSLLLKFCSITSNNMQEICTHMKSLRDKLYRELFMEKMLHLYTDIDLPILQILSQIEASGVKFDSSKLSLLSDEFGHSISELESNIFRLAGREFNIASPKQLGEILFEKLKLPTGSKTSKTKSFSTGAEILESLAEQGFEIGDYLLKWRQLSKLKATYTDSLQKQINPKTGRVHTTFLQTSTATGRLSSVEPNLQNIPIRTVEGERIRNSLVAEKGYKLIAADYSQIELRILAEMANIHELKEAFNHNIDIHTKTASQIFAVAVEDVTSALRRKAKAINFGIIYGISGFGLAKQLGISRKEAKEYIEKYFEAYPGIKEYMEEIMKYAHEHGYVENFLHRRFYVPLIRSTNHTERSFAERAAINAPIQGGASDIVKLAMLKIDMVFKENHLATKMILQVHDELLFEAPESELDTAHHLIKKTMEEIVNFSIRLQVDIEIGDHWS